MITPGPGAVNRLLAGEPVTHRSTALRHAAIHQGVKVRGDDRDHPSSVVYLRRGDVGWEAFASGEPGPVLDRLATRFQGEVIALLAPEAWEPEVRTRGGILEPATILTFTDFDRMRLPRFSPESRALTLDDAAAFAAIAPSWALRSWVDFGAMLEHGLAIGLSSARELVSVAWTYESDPTHDKIGVATTPRYRGLGLGKRVAGAWLERIIRDRGKLPIWVTTPENQASQTLAKRVGFANPSVEKLLRWTPG